MTLYFENVNELVISLISSKLYLLILKSSLKWNLSKNPSTKANSRR